MSDQAEEQQQDSKADAIAALFCIAIVVAAAVFWVSSQ